jgi:hypothetical protein
MFNNDIVSEYFRHLLIVNVATTFRILEQQNRFFNTVAHEQEEVADSFQDLVKVSQDAGADSLWALLGVREEAKK